MEIWSHRGRASPCEFGNSTRSFISALNMNITGIETDICFTPDNKIVVYHPRSTKPDLAEMRWKDISNSIFKIPTLDEFLDLFGLYPDKKCCLHIQQDSKALISMAIDRIAHYKLQSRVYITAFQARVPLPPFRMETNCETLLYAKQTCPEIKTHMMAVWPFNLPRLADKYQPDAISFGWLQEPAIVRMASKSLFKTIATISDIKRQVETVKDMGIKVWGGICNEPEEMLYFIDLGVDGIVTDDPTTLIDLVSENPALENK